MSSPDDIAGMTGIDREVRRAEQAATADVRTLIEPRTADDFWAAAKQLGEIIAAHRAAVRQEQKDARNARRRARYRANPPTRKTKTPVVVDDDLEYEPGCRCGVVRNPPCTWCSGQGDADG